MTDDRQFTTWNSILLVTQIIHLVLGLNFAYQHKYPQTVWFLLFSVICISISKNSHPVIKFLNRTIFSLAVIITFYWYRQ